MILDEKNKLLDLFADKHRWCQGGDARDESGRAVRHDDEDAVAWDIVGGMCLLFGWKRALQLSMQLNRRFFTHRPAQMHINPEIHAMTALVNFNDDKATTYEVLIAKLRELPVWQGKRSESEH